MLFYSLMCYQTDGLASRPDMLNSFLDAPYSRLHFLSWARKWQEAVKYKMKYRVVDVDGYFVQWKTIELSIIQLEMWAKLSVQVPNW